MCAECTGGVGCCVCAECVYRGSGVVACVLRACTGGVGWLHVC